MNRPPIVIREEQLKVLVVESYPRWEYRYLRNVVTGSWCGSFVPVVSPRAREGGWRSQDYLQLFRAIEDLATYDVVFIGDVGIDDDQLTEDQCELLKGLVEQQASGLVFMPGLQGRQFSCAALHWKNCILSSWMSHSRADGEHAPQGI